MQIPYSEACERNKEPILRVIDSYLNNATNVLEIGSGTAQHAVYFSSLKPHIRWQTSDQRHYLSGIEAQLLVSKVANVLGPTELDVNQLEWFSDDEIFDLVYTANTFHIMSEQDVLAFFTGLTNVVKSGAVLVVYGPFRYGGKFTSDSNLAFDERLRSRGVGSGIRDFEWVNELAKKAGLSLVADHKMPANNQCIIWRNDS